MKSKFFKHLKCISPEDDSESQETIQQIESSQDKIQPPNITFRFSKFDLVSLELAQEKKHKLSQDTCVLHNLHLTPDILQKQRSNLKKTDIITKNSVEGYLLNNNNIECDELIKSPQVVVTKETNISEIPISEALPKSNRDTDNALWQEVDSILAPCYQFLNNDENTNLMGLDSTE
ncbi:hypothetical protein [Rickettsia endosymbiont of Nabis limbatus]|uniref:hypothetical protein n=1 Tax=Rickettsia endosymbiont of Nabis limbatus TaxID=3066268 RepID=UPI003AF3F6E7